MCIIAIKKVGINVPDDSLIETMFESNPDGAGFMYNKDGRVIIRKGYMTLKALKTALEDVYKEVDTLNTTFVYHFRIATHGSVKPSLTHPFPISNKIGILLKTSYETDVAVAHNGIIPIKTRTDISDTMEYIVTKLYKRKKKFPNFYKFEHHRKSIETQIKSKMAILDGSGRVEIIGEFIEDKGILYSNTSYTKRYPFCLYDDYTYDKMLCPIEDGYIISDKGEMLDCYDGIYMLDINENVYFYDTYFDFAYKVHGTAYSYEGMPLKFSMDNCLHVNVIY